jgi:hypothetical protein
MYFNLFKLKMSGTFIIVPYNNPGGPKGTWMCHGCGGQPATEKWVYRGGDRGENFKMMCLCCKRMFQEFFSAGCTVKTMPSADS